MQIDKIPTKYLSKKQVKEYQKLKSDWKAAQERYHALHKKMFDFAEIAEVIIKAEHSKTYIGKCYKDVRGVRFVKITGADSDVTMRCAMIHIQTHVKGVSNHQEYISFYPDTSFGISMLDRKQEDSKEWKEISKEEYDEAVRNGLKRIQEGKQSEKN